MKYIQAIFENEDVQTLAVANEDFVQYATEELIDYNLELEVFLNESISDFVAEGDLVQTYANIRDFILTENLDFMNETALILASDLSDEEKVEAVVEAKGGRLAALKQFGVNIGRATGIPEAMARRRYNKEYLKYSRGQPANALGAGFDLLKSKGQRYLSTRELKNQYSQAKQNLDNMKTRGNKIYNQGKTKGGELLTQGKTKGSELLTQGKTKGSELLTQGKTKGSELLTQGKTKIKSVFGKTPSPPPGRLDAIKNYAKKHKNKIALGAAGVGALGAGAATGALMSPESR